MVFQPCWSEIGYVFCALVLNQVCLLEEATFSTLSAIRPTTNNTIHQFELDK